MRWGLLSTARINRSILGAGNADVVAVASRDGARARAYADEHGIATAHGSYEALLADPEVDIVYVSLPNSLHLPWATRALEAGKHVLCEKPLARRAAEVEAAFDLAQARGLVLTEGFMWRHHPQVARTRQLIAEGTIGAVRLIRSDFAFGLTDMADPRARRAMGGGALMDLGCYCVSAARTFAGGEPIAAQAQRVEGGDGVDVALTGLLAFEDDILAALDCAFVGPPRNALEILGDAGRLRLPDPWHARDAVIEVQDAGGAVERIALDPVNHYALQVADVEAAARGERPPLLGRADAVGQARAIELLYAAAGG
ncbi:dTDP-3,4-didehydro-2,6-dideoxy-alpha-D-glucose 3-reductase [Baekduia alba]|uniref:Gfo/Idh/MocA family protein n=1 Tax=Baekduia alba TaxID=2997333 RepID=UPI00233FA81F|nr:Gfo/Idh/MocA family oxidoreductase [Baekduia alba]WCB94397.1 dTDP-3,4-didehydro-2,6-dideoxy-alpha-D-glucose 3-reductase [Baekduia alba]